MNPIATAWRIVVELKRGETPDVVLNNLYKHTQLQMSFGVIMLAIVGGQPKVMTLLELIESVRGLPAGRRPPSHRISSCRKAEARKCGILEGLKIALDHIDAVITLIRASKTVPEARDGLMTQFGLRWFNRRQFSTCSSSALPASSDRRFSTSSPSC